MEEEKRKEKKWSGGGGGERGQESPVQDLNLYLNHWTVVFADFVLSPSKALTKDNF